MKKMNDDDTPPPARPWLCIVELHDGQLLPYRAAGAAQAVYDALLRHEDDLRLGDAKRLFLQYELG